MKRFLLMMLVLNLSLAHAKKDPYELDEVTEEQLKLTSCPTDPEADAFYYFDVGTIRFDWDKSMRSGHWVAYLERKVKIKILTKEGLELANQRLELYHGTGEIELENLKGWTYNLEDGKVEGYKMDKDEIYREKSNEYYDEVKFALPRVQVGSVIEFKYTLKSDFIGNLFDWSFQKKQPVLHSELKVTFPEFFIYNANMKGFYPVQVETGTQRETYHVSYFQASDVQSYGVKTADSYTLESSSSRNTYWADSIPAFKPEAFISSPKNYISSIHFQLSRVKFKGAAAHSYIETWEGVESELRSRSGFGRYLNMGGAAHRAMEDFNLQSTEPLTLVGEIYMNLKHSVAWNGDLRILADHSPGEVLNLHQGNSAELNLLLISMLEEADIDAYPVLVSTRKHGYVDKFNPSLQQFNHVLAAAAVDGQLILLDLTGNTPPGILPYHSLNLTGRLMAENGTWINLEPGKSHAGNYFYNLQLDMDKKQLRGTARFKMKDFAANDYRERIHSFNTEEEFKSDLGGDFNYTSIDSLKVENKADIFEDLNIVMGLTANEAVEVLGDKILLKANLFNGVGENPFSGQERHYPIDFAYPRSSVSSVTLQLPEGYELASEIEPVKIVLPDNKGSFIYQVRAMGNMIQISSQFMINTSIFSENDFEYLRQFYALSLEKINEPLVLTKI